MATALNYPRTLHRVAFACWAFAGWPLVGCSKPPAPGAAERLSVKCCTMACFPDGALGQDCTLDRLRKRLETLASDKNLTLDNVECQTTTEPCNTTCESPPGVRLHCGGAARR